LKHFTLKDADALTAACVEWAWAWAVVAHVFGGCIIGGGRRQSEITALCHLWQCAVAALDKTNDGAEWQISARSVTDFHWIGTDPIHSDRSRSRLQSQYQDRCVL